MRRFIAATTAAVALGSLGAVGYAAPAQAAPAAPAAVTAGPCNGQLHLYLDLFYVRYTLLCL